jgi:hypothetical protein
MKVTTNLTKLLSLIVTFLNLSLNDWDVVERDVSSGKTKYIEDSWVLTVKLQLEIEIVIQGIIELVLLAFDDLKGLGEVISHGEVVSFNLAVDIIEAFVQVVQLAIFSEIADLWVGSNEDFSLSHGQVKREITIWL